MASFVFYPDSDRGAYGQIARNKNAIGKVVSVVERSTAWDGTRIAEIRHEQLGYLGQVEVKDLVQVDNITQEVKNELLRRKYSRLLEQKKGIAALPESERSTDPVIDNPLEKPRPEQLREKVVSHRSQSAGYRGTKTCTDAEALALKNAPKGGIGKFQVKCKATKAPIIGDDIAEAHNLANHAQVAEFLE